MWHRAATPPKILPVFGDARSIGKKSWKRKRGPGRRHAGFPGFEDAMFSYPQMPGKECRSSWFGAQFANQCRASSIRDICDRLKQSEATTSVSTGALEHSQITADSCGPAVCFWIKVQP